jgi:hypothetical protein
MKLCSPPTFVCLALWTIIAAGDFVVDDTLVDRHNSSPEEKNVTSEMMTPAPVRKYPYLRFS